LQNNSGAAYQAVVTGGNGLEHIGRVRLLSPLVVTVEVAHFVSEKAADVKPADAAVSV
jgi:hypothetical protein